MTVVTPNPLSTIFADILPDPSFLQGLAALCPQQPEPGMLIWSSDEPNQAGSYQAGSYQAGLYIVTAGKVRVLDAAGDLLRSLDMGGYFGAESSFPMGDRGDYHIRASLGTEIVWIETKQLQHWFKQFPSLQESLKSCINEGFGALNHKSGQLPPPAPLPPPPKRQSPPSAPKASQPKASQPKASQPQPLTYFPNPKVRASHAWQKLTHKYPFVAQQSTVDCGVACLVMIGQFWGKRLNLNQLRELAQVDRGGATLKGLIQAAEAVGFAARPVKATLAQLAEQSLPAIVHWEGKHYIVVYEINRREVMVADPEIGCRRLSPATFVEKWTGYTLLLSPTAQLHQTANTKSGLWRFTSLLKPHWRVLTEITLTSLVIQVFGLVTPLITQLLLDRVVVQRSDRTLIALGIGLILFSAFRLGLKSLRQYLLDHTANRIDLALVVGFINHTLRLRLGYFETRYVGDIISRIAENQKIRRFITGDAITTLLDLVTVFVYVGLMFWYSWSMALLALILVPILAILAFGFAPFLQQNSRESFNAKNNENSYLIEVLTGMNTIKSMGLERIVRWRWERLFSQFIKLNFSGQILRERLKFASTFAETIVSQLLLLMGLWQVIHGQLTVGQLLAFNMLLGNVLSPFQRLMDLWDDFQEILISVERLNDVLESPPEADPQAQRLTLPPIQGAIRLENVTFRYNLDSPNNILANLSLTIQAGETIAIVGRSGSGKTTLSKLLLGLYLPVDGKILIDGHDMATLNLQSLRQQVGVVDQNTFLFGGSVQDNLTIAAPGATMAEIQTAAALAGADQFIQDLPMGYDTQIGEGGGMLSGGQRQRLAIARALLRQPRLLILDEATSALDTESERIIQENFQNIFHRQTTIVIAHRLSTVKQADRILVLDRGVLVEQGNHQELMAKRGQYYHLNQQQLTVS
jgi:HlyB family type I secretion system ABC transporter